MRWAILLASSNYSPEQYSVIERPLEGAVFLEGPAGAGKTTAGVGRLVRLLESGVPADSILVLVPQRSLAKPYQDALALPELNCCGVVELSTVNGLAQRMVDLFWPVAAGQAGFAQPNQPPVFLTMETAQYYLASLVRPLLDEGFFDSVVIDRNRLYSQILDNLNKSALVGFYPGEIGERLCGAWLGETSQKRIYTEAQDCALRFREFCLEHNLLDFSLQLEVFWKHLWPLEICRGYLKQRYRHLIFDNLEEDTPLAHDLVREWLPDFESALLIFDHAAGYRLFLGADPQTAYPLKELCPVQIRMEDDFVAAPGVARLRFEFERALGQTSALLADDLPAFAGDGLDARRALGFHPDQRVRFHAQMVDWVAERIAGLVREGQAQPGEIAVLSPYLSDALRFGLANRLEKHGIPIRTNRPSRGLRDDPPVRCLLSLARLAHPDWEMRPGKQEIATCLVQAIDGLDLVRAQLLTGIVYRVRDGRPGLGSFDQILPDMRERITYEFGQNYETLRGWLHEYQAGEVLALDHFLSRLFGEVLSQPGFGFHRRYDAGAAAARLIESVRKFRWVTGETMRRAGWWVGREYIHMVQDGVLSAQYLQPWEMEENAVLLTPASSFLMSNRPVDIQFWLDVGGQGWWERLDQPLTQPYVLSRSWPEGRVWSDADEYAANQEMLARVIGGLLRRCRRQVYLGMSDLSESGYEQQGPLLRVVQNVLRQMPALDDLEETAYV